MRLLAGLLLLVPFAAFGQGSANLTCTPPTTNTDNTPITGTISYRFLRGTAQTGPFTDPRTATACSFTWTGLAVGTHFFVAQAVVNGVMSGNSNVSSVVIAPPPPPTPRPPTNLTVTTPVAYELRQRSDGSFVANRVGVVPLGTFCGTESKTVGAQQYNRVEPADTDFVNWPLTTEVWAKCG